MSTHKKNYYKLIAPRPTVCVSTLNENGVSNLAPYSFTTPISFTPPLLGIAVGSGKDTIINARKTREFVVAPLTKDWSDKGIQSEVSIPMNESEFKEVGLTETDSEKIKPPSVKEAPINIECEYWNDFEAGDHYLLVGEVVYISVQREAIKKGRINLEKLGSVGHITGEEFCISEESVEIERR